MTKTKKIWIFLIVLWLLVWTIFAIEMIYPDLGLTASRITYLIVAPIVFGLGLWWVRRD